MICQLCKGKYEGHFNSKYCSILCKKKVKSNINRKYNNKLRDSKVKNINDDNIDGEIWKDIIGYEGIYMISNLGRIKSTIRKGGGGFLKPHLGKIGYYTVGLRIKNKGFKTHTLHRLLGIHFIDNPNNYQVIDHIDRDKTNNKLENLRWVSMSDNSLNSDRSENKKGCICQRKDYNKKLQKYYYSYRVYYGNKSKTYKTKEECIKWLDTF